MRQVALIDPSLFTLPYDSALATGLADIGYTPLIFGCAERPSANALRSAFLVEHFYRSLHAQLGKSLPKKLLRFGKGLLHAHDLQRLRARLQSEPPEIIHFQWLPLPIVDQLFLPGLGQIAPLVLTIHDTRPFNGDAGRQLQVFGLEKAFRHFRAFIVHTTSARARLVNNFGIDARIVHVIPHGLLASSMRYSRARSTGSRIKLLVFGKIKPYKGIDVLLSGLGRLSESDREHFDVVIAGEPHMDMSALFGLKRDLGLNRVRFVLEFLSNPEMALLFEEADLIVLPYREIDASGVLMSAIDAELAIIASRIGGFADLLTDGTDALLVPAGNADELATALRRLVRDPELLSRLQCGVRTLRRAIPAWSDIARSTGEVYQLARLSTSG